MQTIENRRARDMAEMRQLQSRMLSPADVGAAIASYRPEPTDVIISPYGKCGTTWLQQTFHTLRTGGDMDFDDISRVTPWIETAGLLQIDLNAPQRARPRGYKSHLPYPALPSGARYVVSFRDPKDAVVSMHRFMEGWFLEPGAVPADDFAKVWLARDGGQDYWTHLLSWWAERDNPSVLLLSYEQMTDDPAGSVRRLAAFCDIRLSPELLDLTLERSSFDFMLRHKNKFDDLMMRQASEKHCGLPPGSDSAKVRAGGVGGHKGVLSPAMLEALDRKWAETVAPATGFADYAALDAALRRRS